MKDFAGRFAVVTGGGTGMGRELARQLIAEGCSVAMCDVSAKTMAETIALCEADGVPQGAKITAHIADVCASERQSFRASLVGYLSLQFPDVDAGDHMTTANKAIALAQKDVVTAFMHHKESAK